jgi:polyhydroxyalkanoate synthase
VIDEDVFQRLVSDFGTSTRGHIELASQLLKGAEALTSMRTSDVDVGTTPKDEVYRDGHVVLYRYRPLASRPLSPPVLITYSLINRYYMVDLQPDRSLVRSLLRLGLDLYVVDWGYATRADRWTTLDDYVTTYIADCCEVIRARHDVEKINVLGICQGGVLSLCYAALHPEKVDNLIVMITPVDFDADTGLISRFARSLNVDQLVDAFGNIPKEFINYGFLMRSPFQQNIRKYADLLDIVDDREKLLNFLRMEKWLFDSPDHPGEVFRKWIKDFYQENKLVKGTLEIDGVSVALSQLRMPILNLYGTQDDIIEPASSIALERHVGTRDYTARAFPVGHIGMYVSSKVQRDLPVTIAGWLNERTN